MELINKTNQVQQIEFVDGSGEIVMPNKKSNPIKPGTIRNTEFDRLLKFFKIAEKQVKPQPVKQVSQEPKPAESEPKKTQYYNKEVNK